MRPGPTARAAAVLVVFLALFIAVDRLSGPRSPRSVIATGSSRPAASATSRPVAPSSSRAPATTTPSTAATTGTTSRPTRATSTTHATGTTLRSAEGVTVQVLNAAFVPGLARRVADRIRRAGYDVIAINTAFGTYTASRVYYTEGHQADAEAFQARFPAFQTILPASRSRTGLDRDVDLHVVIGQNYPDLE